MAWLSFIELDKAMVRVVRLTRNGKDLTESGDIKKRRQEYKEELYRKDLQDQDNHKGVITHLEPDILEVKSSGL